MGAPPRFLLEQVEMQDAPQPHQETPGHLMLLPLYRRTKLFRYKDTEVIEEDIQCAQVMPVSRRVHSPEVCLCSLPQNGMNLKRGTCSLDWKGLEKPSTGLSLIVGIVG